VPEFPKSVMAYLDEPCQRCGVAIGKHHYRMVPNPKLPSLPITQLICPPTRRRRRVLHRCSH
jgi:hypothetical protein